MAKCRAASWLVRTVAAADLARLHIWSRKLFTCLSVIYCSLPRIDKFFKQKQMHHLPLPISSLFWKWTQKFEQTMLFSINHCLFWFVARFFSGYNTYKCYIMQKTTVVSNMSWTSEHTWRSSRVSLCLYHYQDEEKRWDIFYTVWAKKDRARIYETGTDFLKNISRKKWNWQNNKKPKTDEHKKIVTGKVEAGKVGVVWTGIKIFRVRNRQYFVKISNENLVITECTSSSVE
jgi:hypothetical protein